MIGADALQKMKQITQKKEASDYDKLPEDQSPYDHVPADIYDSMPSQKPKETAPILIEVEMDGSNSGQNNGDYLTPRALVEPEWLHGCMSRKEAETMVQVRLTLFSAEVTVVRTRNKGVAFRDAILFVENMKQTLLRSLFLVIGK